VAGVHVVTPTWDDLRGSDIIDTRDIIERLNDLQGQDSEDDGSGLDSDERDELDTLERLVDEYGDSFEDRWSDGVTLISDSYFEDYAEQVADDIGAIDRNAGWPLMYIDWTAAAEALQQDYTSITIEGTEYWGR
jgi:hypothetical protein